MIGKLRMLSDLAALVHASPYVLLGIFFVLRFALWTYMERRAPRFQVSFRAVLLSDLLTSFFLFFVTIPLCDRLIVRVLPNLPIPASIMTWPVALRVALYLVLADLGHYWLHRLMHTPLFWRMHKWHHVPTHMSWLAGNRESFLDRFLVSLPYFFFWPLLHVSPWWTGTFLLMFASVKNDWMHLNVSLRTGWLEWLIVTPRYHHVHHSADTEHYTKNLAPLFAVWDRMFGTYAKPDERKLTFGIGEEVKTVRLIAGL